LKRIFAVAFCVIMISGMGLAWQGARNPDDQTISVNVDLVNVLFTVTDKKGKIVPTLKQEAFKVFEDGKPQTITNFSAESDLPLTIALLVDTSGSIREQLRFEQQAAIEFFSSILTRGKDRALAIAFDTGVELVQDYTDDSDKLARSIQKMRAGGGTALFDAIDLVATQKLAGQKGRRIMVVISDGDDTSSHLSMAEALTAAQQNDVVIYSISTNAKGLGGDKSVRGDKILKTFTDETGGRMFSPLKIQDLNSNFKDILSELRLQYALAYRPANAVRNGAFRRIRIEPMDKRYVVRARNGYYAPRSSLD
jgi:Ca-activated chloride channel homolog